MTPTETTALEIVSAAVIGAACVRLGIELVRAVRDRDQRNDREVGIDDLTDEPIDLDELHRIIKALPREPVLVEIRVGGHETFAWLRQRLAPATTIHRAPGILGVPVIVDEALAPGVLRYVMSDGTHTDAGIEPAPVAAYDTDGGLSLGPGHIGPTEQIDDRRPAGQPHPVSTLTEWPTWMPPTKPVVIDEGDQP